jgi:DtxR family Mn-dependent transcriptional regulator
MLRKLKDLRFVRLHAQTGIHLTPFGQKTALQTIRRHRLLELYLVRELGYRWDEVHDEAERLEHHISPLFEERIAERLGNPEFDPHGDPIPTSGGELRTIDDKSLMEFESPSSLIITRLLDVSPDLLRFAADLKLRPGTEIEFIGQEPFGGRFKLKLNKKEIFLPPDAARQVFAREVK